MFMIFFRTGINVDSNELKIWIPTDNSGYYVTGYDSSNFATICKYSFSTSSAICQQITNIQNGYGLLMVSQTQFFMLREDLTINDLHIKQTLF